MKSIHHSFDIDLATEYGIEQAILIHHFQYWIRYNKKLNRNLHDGHTWTFQTRNEIIAHFSYWSTDQVRRYIDKLVEKKVLIKGNYNKNPEDNTVWYAFQDEEKWVGQNSPRSGESAQGSGELANYIPNTLSNTKTKIVCSESPVGDPQKKLPSENITKKNARGEQITISKSEIFRRSISQPNWKTTHIQQAIETLESYEGIVNDLWAFIEGTIRNLNNKTKGEAIQCKKTQQKPKKSKIESCLAEELPTTKVAFSDLVSFGQLYPEFCSISPIQAK